MNYVKHMKWTKTPKQHLVLGILALLFRIPISSHFVRQALLPVILCRGLAGGSLWRCRENTRRGEFWRKTWAYNMGFLEQDHLFTTDSLLFKNIFGCSQLESSSNMTDVQPLWSPQQLWVLQILLRRARAYELLGHVDASLDDLRAVPCSVAGKRMSPGRSCRTVEAIFFACVVNIWLHGWKSKPLGTTGFAFFNNRFFCVALDPKPFGYRCLVSAFWSVCRSCLVWGRHPNLQDNDTLIWLFECFRIVPTS